MKKLLFLSAAAFIFTFANASSAATTCTFDTIGSTMSLNGDCTTDSSIVVPNGFTLDGNGYTITGEDPSGGHFTGGVIQNGGATANVTNVKVTVTNLIEVCDSGAARLRGILFDTASGSITGNIVTNINQGQSGCQEGNAIEVRNFTANAETSRVTIDGNRLTGYQKTGIIANGNVNATITDNYVDGLGPVGYIARNGIQFGYGASGMAKKNTVIGNGYTGSSDVSGGILVVGGPYYGEAYCKGIQIIQNTITDNDIGVFISQLEVDFSAPITATNLKVVNNVIAKTDVTNGYVYQAGVSDVGNNDKIITNTISGAGYSPMTQPGSTFAIDADTAFTNKPKVHANK